MGRTTTEKSKNKKNNLLTAAEVKVYIENNLRQQRRAYEEGLPGAQGEAPEAVPAEIDIDTWLDAEHFDGTLRGMIGDRDLADSVAICPVYNADAVEQASTNVALNKVLANTTLKTKLDPNGDRVLDRPSLPEPRNLFNAELNKIKKLDKETKEELTAVFQEYYNEAEEFNRELQASESVDETPFKENESLAEKIAEIETQIESLELPKLSVTKLKKALNRAVDAVENKLRRLNEYNQQDQAFNLEAQNLLADSGFSEETLFHHYLDAVVDSRHHFLGNTQNRNLSFYDEACNQLIIPFRKNGSHYTVAVAHMYQENKKQVANIKYYDSMGGDLEENLQTQMVEFFKNKGFEVEYECVSEPEQKEGHNCSIFASHKGIDIANENAGNDERLLDGLNDENYDQVFSYLRYVITRKLSAMGQNVSAAKGLVKDVQHRQREFVKLSKQETQLNEFKRLLRDLGDGLENVLNKVKNTRSIKPKKTNSILPDLDPNALFKKCEQLCSEMHDLLEQKQALGQKSKKDNENIQALIAGIQSFKSVKEDLQNELKRFQKNVGSPAQVSDLQSWVRQLDWKKVVAYGSLGGLGLFIGLPYLLAFIITYSPLNPLVSIIGGAAVFALGALAINTIGSYVTDEQKKKDEDLKLDEKDESELEDDDEEENELEDDNEEENKKASDNIVDLGKERIKRSLLPQFNAEADAEKKRKKDDLEKKDAKQKPEKEKPKPKKK